MFSCHKLQESCMKYFISFALKSHEEDISAVGYGDRKTGNLACHLDIVNMWDRRGVVMIDSVPSSELDFQKYY